MQLEHAEAMAHELMAEHGLQDWNFTFDRAKRRAGVCRYATRTISLSRHLTQLHDAELVRDTLLHEIAHALAGAKAGHGPAWREIAARVGARPQRLLPADAPLPPAPWRGRCPGGHDHRRFRRPAQPVSCAQCCPVFCLAHLITWTHHGEPMEVTEAYRRSLRVSRRQAAGRPPCRGCGQRPSGSERAEPEPVLLW